MKLYSTSAFDRAKARKRGTMNSPKPTVLIQGGTLIDPSQNLHTKASLLCEGTSVSQIIPESDGPALAQARSSADRLLDAAGRIVCPGFVDIHMHEDPCDLPSDSLDRSIARSMALMGVTSALGGNCGTNKCHPSDYLDLVDRHGTATNVGLLAGHTFLRNLCGGTDKYGPVSDETLQRMIDQAKLALDAGCFGVSFGVKYIPGTEWKEIVGLAGLCRETDRLVSSHVRNDVSRVFSACGELARIGREAGVRVQFSHIGSMGGYGQMPRLLEQIEGYRREGIDMMADCYPYDAFSTDIGATTYDDGFLEEYQSDYSHIQLADGKYAGQRCTKEIFDELRAEAPDTLTIGYFMREEDVDLALRSPFVMVGSDGLRNGLLGHPRAAGTFPRVLSRYVKRGVLDLDTAIAKMTWIPAQRIGLSRKGSLAVGCDADVVIFDADRIIDRATFTSPALPPEGIDYVLMGGQVAVDHGHLVREDLGRSLRFGKC